MTPSPQPSPAGGGSRLPTYPRRSAAPPRGDKPEWLKVRFFGGPEYLRLQRLMRSESLHTVCEEARCPNRAECWSQGTATLLLLGDVCTRACGFCNIATGWPSTLDADEPRRVARAVAAMGLRHVVLTSVTRDDLADGGAHIFAESITLIREAQPGCSIEILIPDLQGNWGALAGILEAQPEILNHNLETVPRLYGLVRPKARYAQSLELLSRSKALYPGVVTKSGLMVGFGETRQELEAVFADLRSVDVDMLTIGQYLRPTAWHIPMDRYYDPSEFVVLRESALGLGFRHVEAGPLVRSSYHASEQLLPSLDGVLVTG